MSTTERPRFCRCSAAETPTIPAPRTIASVRMRSGYRDRERARHRFQRLPLGCDAPDRLDDSGDDHQHGAEEITEKHAAAHAALDEVPEEDRSGDAADSGADRVEECDRQRADFDRKRFAHGE